MYTGPSYPGQLTTAFPLSQPELHTLSVTLSQKKCSYFDVFTIRIVSKQSTQSLHESHSVWQNMITSSQVHIGPATADVNQRDICAVWFSLQGTYKFMLNPQSRLLEMIRKRGLAESQCLFNLSLAGKFLNVFFLVLPFSPPYRKMHQHFLKRKRQRLGVNLGGSLLAWHEETLASIPSSTNKLQATSPRERYFSLGSSVPCVWFPTKC